MAKYQFEKQDAIAIDTAGTLEVIAAGMRLCAEYTVKSAYANQSLTKRLIALERKIGKIAKKTGVNVSDVRKEVAEVKEFLNGQKFTDVAAMFQKAEDEAKKREKKGEECLDFFTRSH